MYTMWLARCGFVLILITGMDSFTCEEGNNTNISEGPLFSIKPSHVYAHVGDIVHFTCEGYFSSDTYPEERSLMWFKRDIPVVVLNDRRYTMERRHKDNESKVWSQLTIANVTAADYNTSLRCELATPSPGHQPCAQVWLRPFPPSVETDIGLVLAIVIPLVVVLFLVVLFVVYHLHKPKIAFFLYSWYRKIHRQHQTNNFDSDVIVVHDEDDHTFVREHIVPKLKSLGYLRYKTMAQDLSSFQMLFEGTQELMKESYTVLFIITPEILNEALFSHLLNVAVKLKRHIIPVTVHQKGLQLSSWEDLKKTYSRSESLGTGLQYLRTVSWPGDQASSRQKENFWYKIRRQLPLNHHRSVTYTSRYTPTVDSAEKLTLDGDNFPV